jgi:hypothetical protein
MNQYEMVVIIVAVVMFASVLRARFGVRYRKDGAAEVQDSVENARMRDEVTRLRDRVAVLERIVTDKNHLLEQEFDRLRDQ